MTKTKTQVDAAEKVAEDAEVTKELKVHTDARDARVSSVKALQATAKLAREAQVLLGLTETEGAELDRMAKEASDLAEASELNVVEPFALTTRNDIDLNLLEAKLNEVIEYLNNQSQK